MHMVARHCGLYRGINLRSKLTICGGAQNDRYHHTSNKACMAAEVLRQRGLLDRTGTHTLRLGARGAL